MCGPEPCKSPTPCGRCERGAARLAAMEVAVHPRADHVGSLEVATRREERIARVLRVIPTTSD
jgi:hypothetical protein